VTHASRRRGLGGVEVHGPADVLLVVDAELEVGPAGAIAGPPERAVGAHSITLPLEHVLVGIAGARARAEIHVAEALVNEALVEIRAVAASHSGSTRATGPQPWLAWLREFSVRFDRAQLVVLAEVEVPDPADAPVTDPIAG